MDQLVTILSQLLGRFINSECKENERRTIQISVLSTFLNEKINRIQKTGGRNPFRFVRSLNKKSAELISNRLSCASYFYRVALLLLLPRSDPCTVATRYVYNSNSAGSWICRPSTRNNCAYSIYNPSSSILRLFPFVLSH